MSISSILDLLALSWSHAYCTEGPAFGSDAVFGSSGGGLVTGYMTLNSGETTISLWPDEIGSDDLTQATPADQPLFVTSSADFNGKPVVQVPGTGTARFLRNTLAVSMGSDFEVVVVGRLIIASGLNLFAGNGTNIAITTTSGPAWMLVNHSGGGNATGGPTDTTAHDFRGVWQIPGNPFSDSAELFVDEVSDAFMQAAFLGHDSLTGITIGSSSTAAGIEVAFVGVAAQSALSAGDRSDIHSFAQSHFGSP